MTKPSQATSCNASTRGGAPPTTSPWPDLPARQPAAARALTLDHVKPRLLGHWGTTPGLNLVYAHMNRAIVQRDLNAMYVTGPGHGGPGLVASTWLEGPTPSSIPTSRATRRACASSSASSRSRAGFRATSRPRPRARSTKAVSSGTRWCTPTAPRSTTRICWSAASSATARPRRARSRRAGTRTSSSTRRATARCCRSCTSTATRSPTRRCWRASRRTSCARCWRATGTRRGSSPATTRRRCTRRSPRRSTGARRDRRDPAPRP